MCSIQERSCEIPPPALPCSELCRARVFSEPRPLTPRPTWPLLPSNFSSSESPGPLIKPTTLSRFLSVASSVVTSGDPQVKKRDFLSAVT
ncbi:hypothetical protein AAFF_G00243550 [Aldrovandia affinis]|uniref:Uncharacterized protein n=1 Tax=Aldrovandia affinis TaxID=143900 RepID=A0AAD7W3H8_9TELE|nr:hypothetical protein AAFF_G00243550 [Aldrovandia affinis]